MSLADLGREAARDAAQDELRRQEYLDAQPSLLLRVVGRVLRELGALLDRAAAAAPGGLLGLLALLALLALLVAVVLSRVGPLARRRTGSSALFEGSAVLSAAQHRDLAEQAAGESRFADAVRERLRAVVRDLEARGAIDPRPGRTAGEVARDGGSAVPAVADDLRRAAVLFDEVWYGGRTADASSYAVLVGVDERVAAARPVPA
ncbi:MAG: putative integral rane protein [Frankiales bacterium]|nr:putative integral rane protein [Frankiales bacterium]